MVSAMVVVIGPNEQPAVCVTVFVLGKMQKLAGYVPLQQGSNPG